MCHADTAKRPYGELNSECDADLWLSSRGSVVGCAMRLLPSVCELQHGCQQLLWRTDPIIISQSVNPYDKVNLYL